MVNIGLKFGPRSYGMTPNSSPSCFVSHVVPSIGGGRGELAAGEIYCQSPLIRALMHELELLREQPAELLGRAARWR